MHLPKEAAHCQSGLAAISIFETEQRSAAPAEADDLVQLLTPLVKSYLSEVCGHDAAQMAVQVYGGHGYIRDNGVEQYARDAGIAMIYEGANGIQALDLVGRKLPAHMGRYLRRFFHPVQKWIDANTAMRHCSLHLPLAARLAADRHRPDRPGRPGKPHELAPLSSEYLKLFALSVLAFLWAQMLCARARKRRMKRFLSSQDRTAHFMERVLPQTGSLFSAIMVGGKTMMEFPDDAF